jgi:hypothetical protein
VNQGAPCAGRMSRQRHGGWPGAESHSRISIQSKESLVAGLELARVEMESARGELTAIMDSRI